MKFKKWDFEVGKKYDLSDVIGACNARIREGGVIRSESKFEMVREMEKLTLATVVWCPKGNGGWGASPFNKNCWRTVAGGPIIPSDVDKSERKIGAVSS